MNRFTVRLSFACMLLLVAPIYLKAQQTAAQPTPVPAKSYADYQASAEKKFDLVHTKLEVSFDYDRQRMPGKATITLQPHFYQQDQLMLDAKGMFINEVSLVEGAKKTKLKFDYSDSMQLHITLPRSFKATEKLTVFIDYVARPNEVKVKGSAAITDAKGLYFINPKGEDPDKAIQIWTQGETEATSVWCPTIDRPNQKTTQEILMTVPDKYVSLSNGKLVNQQKNSDGTRTDHWKMDQPHAPYLFFMGVGDYAVVKDQYKTLPVDYYVEHKWEPVAKRIFGDTPDMIDFFSKLLRTPYPWVKYAQIVGQDYVSGAMENTTSTLHGAMAYQNARQLADENSWEIVVAHELFHQWFGDLVTTESWSNLTVNESFADYSEYLWLEHKYGRERADAYNYIAMQGYMSNGANAEKHLVRFYYEDKEEMFDAVSYQKGGRILHMLRHHLGDSAFAWGMHEYLKQNQYGTGEAHQLRLAMEKVSGKDLNWFFNQWYFNNGHPVAFIDHKYDDTTKTYHVIIAQKQDGDLFEIPVDIDVYNGKNKTRHTVWLRNAIDTFSFEGPKPTHLSVDGDKVILWQKEENKSSEEWITQYRHAANYLDKYEALIKLMDDEDSEAIRATMYAALGDTYFGIREIALGYFSGKATQLSASETREIEAIAQADPNRPTRAAAIDVLGATANDKYTTMLQKAMFDSSYSVAGAATEALLSLKSEIVLAKKEDLAKDAKGRLEQSMQLVGYLEKDVSEWQSVVDDYKNQPPFGKFTEMKGVLFYANRLEDMEAFRKTASLPLEFYNQYKRIPQIEPVMRQQIDWLINQKKRAIAANPNDETARKQLEYIESKIQ